MSRPKNGKFIRMTMVRASIVGNSDNRTRHNPNNYVKIKYLKAIPINGELWYPTTMVAYFMMKDKNNAVEYKRRTHGLASYLSNGKDSLTPFGLAYRKAFRKFDGNWFTTEKLFNEARTSLDRLPIKFEPIIEKKKWYSKRSS